MRRECVTALPFTSPCTSNCATCSRRNKRVTRLFVSTWPPPPPFVFPPPPRLRTCSLLVPSVLRVLPMPVHHPPPVPSRGRASSVTKRSSHVTLRSRATASTAALHVHLSLGDLHRALRQPADLSAARKNPRRTRGSLTTGEPVTSRSLDRSGRWFRFSARETFS